MTAELNTQAFSDRCWALLERYWVLPLPPASAQPGTEGFCVVCGDWVPRTDPEESGCPRRYLVPHAEILPFVVQILKTLGTTDEWLRTSDLRAAAKRGYEQWKAASDGLS